MKKIVKQTMVGLLVSGSLLSAMAGGPEVAPAPLMMPGLYFGLGGGLFIHYTQRSYALNEYNSTLSPVNPRNSIDSINFNEGKFSPSVQMGYWGSIGDDWLLGVQARYNYLNYQSAYQSPAVLVNATQVADNTSGAVGLHEVAVQTAFTHQLLLLAYAGKQFTSSYIYWGIGGAMWTIADYLGVEGPTSSSGVVIPAFSTPSNNMFTKNRARNTVWGGAAQVGYNFYLSPTWFIGLDYTYATSGVYSNSRNIKTVVFDGVGNETLFNGSDASTAKTGVSRRIRITTQDFMFSLNKVFVS